MNIFPLLIAFSCFAPNVTIAYQVQSTQVIFTAYRADNLAAHTKIICDDLYERHFTATISIGNAEFQLKTTTFKNIAQYEFSFECQELGSEQNLNLTCNATNVKTYQIASYIFDFTEEKIQMSDVAQNFRVRWFDHSNCWKDTVGKYSTDATSVGINIEQQVLGCDIQKDSAATDASVNINFNEKYIFPEKLIPISIGDIVDATKNANFACAEYSNATLRTQCEQDVLTLLDADQDAYISYFAQVPTSFTILVRKPNSDIRDDYVTQSFNHTVNYAAQVKQFVNRDVNDCFIDDSFKISFHKIFINIMYERKPTDAIVNCPLLQNLSRKVKLTLTIRSDVSNIQKSLTVDWQVGLIIANDRATSSTNFFLNLEQITDPEQRQQYQDVAQIATELDDFTIDLKIVVVDDDEVEIGRLSYAIPRFDQCYADAVSIVYSDRVCFNLNRMQTCTSDTSIHETKVNFNSDEMVFDVQDEIFILEENCISVVGFEGKVQMFQRSKEFSYINIYLDGFCYPSSSYSSLQMAVKFDYMWYACICFAVVIGLLAFFVGYCCYRSKSAMDSLTATSGMF